MNEKSMLHPHPIADDGPAIVHLRSSSTVMSSRIARSGLFGSPASFIADSRACRRHPSLREADSLEWAVNLSGRPPAICTTERSSVEPPKRYQA